MLLRHALIQVTAVGEVCMAAMFGVASEVKNWWERDHVQTSKATNQIEREQWRIDGKASDAQTTRGKRKKTKRLYGVQADR